MHFSAVIATNTSLDRFLLFKKVLAVHAQILLALLLIAVILFFVWLILDIIMALRQKQKK